MTYNPSLRIIPRNQTADVLPTQQEPSILTWLEGTGRLKAREVVVPVTAEEESEEIDDLMGDSDKSFDVDDDDDDDLSLDDDD
ncbi:DUF3134 domain-containing protein [Oscillatoria sp. CS-180]|uniref:DUF3134 domain-containing protein n=1 Tax=Oscillatoria sp. CS-180 TaxID=3021720 RepID=UPI0023306E8A|nr:DUF3134 domain-containing protein [Oscillatoria sp. CS-180]MDB9524416.1 DUF3134 domain-containing protein [Oscillatoria sp. CS-180]